MMESIIDTIFSNSIYIFIFGTLVLFIIYTIIKKILKMTLFFGFVLLTYLLYLNYVGSEIPKSVDDLKESLSKNAEKVKDIASKSLDEAKSKTTTIIERKVDEKVNDLFKE
jgi:diacylglycerol kinase